MDNPPTPQLLRAICPHCRKAYAVTPEQVGQTTPCRQCGQNFTVTLWKPPTCSVAAPVENPTANSAEPPLSAPLTPTEPNGENSLLCPICQHPVDALETVTACPACNTVHHQECWDYNHGCGLYGCGQAPETEKLQDIEIPASYWGQTEKQCPQCQQQIQAAALRCRYCGLTFENARPQETTEFAAQIRDKQAILTHKRIGILLLILAAIPCTAPLAALGGGIWYLAVRRHIAAMSPLNATICRLAIGLALAVTAILVLIAVVYSAFNTPIGV